MKQILFTLLFIMLTLLSGAQSPVNIGIKAGFNSSTMVTDIDDVLNQNIQHDNVNNYIVGAFVRLNAGRLYAQPELYFNSKGGEINSFDTSPLAIATSTIFDYQSLDLPILLGVKLIDKNLFNVRIHTGPVFSFITTNSFKTELSNLSKDDISKNYIGWQFGAGIDILMISIDARIENSSNLLSSSSAYEAKSKVYLLTAGIRLF